MAKAKVNMNAFNKSMNSLEEAFVQRLDKIEKAFVKTMKTMEQEAITAAPIDTGELKNSIKWKEVNKLSYELRADVYYAAYVEFGTGPYVIVNKYDSYWQDIALPFKSPNPSPYNRKIQAQPFFYPTVNKNVAKLRDKIKNILSKNEG
jgi:HK97 gp10 family phage protein